MVLGIGPLALTGLVQGVDASIISNHPLHCSGVSAPEYLEMKHRFAVLCIRGVHPCLSSECRSGMGVRGVGRERRDLVANWRREVLLGVEGSLLSLCPVVLEVGAGVNAQQWSDLSSGPAGAETAAKPV